MPRTQPNPRPTFRCIVFAIGLLFCHQVSLAQVDETVAAAREAARQGRVDEATSALEELRAGAGLDAAGERLLGELYLQAGRASDAAGLLVPAARRPSADAELKLLAGQASTRAGDAETATQLFTEALRADPESPAARELGALFGAMGDYRQSYPLLLNWVQRHPDDGMALLLAGLAAVELERPVEAGQLLAPLDQEDPRVRQLQGQALAQQGKSEEAIAILRPLLAEAHPEQLGELRHALADAYLDTDQPLAAVELIEGNVGDDVGLAIKLSEAFERAGYDASAASVIQRFVEPLTERLDELPEALRTDAADMSLRYGRVQLATGATEEALRYLEIATDLLPDDLDAWRLLREAREAAGQTDAAAEAAARVAELEARPEVTDELDELTDLLDDTARKVREASLLSRTDPAAALAELQYEAQIVPTDPRPPLAAARILLNQSQLEEATTMVDFALRLVPQRDDPGAESDTLWRQLRLRALSLKARISASRNLVDEARAALEEALQLAPEDQQLQQRLLRLNAQP